MRLLRPAFGGARNDLVGVIGCGNMGSALVAGMIRSRFRRPSQVLIWDPEAGKRNRLAKNFRVRVARSNGELAGASEAILLAVKPREMAQVLAQIRPHLGHRPLVISIAAGISAGFIERHLGPGIPVVRVMPNTPALVGKGVAAIAAGRWAGKAHPAAVERLFRSVGVVLRVPERWMDAVTAVSGSGPAYLFFLMEQMIEAGVRLGLSKAVARRLALETVRGAAELAAQSREDPAVLRARVTSKGGTTEAAFRLFERARLGEILQAGIQAAARRAKELRT